MDEILQNHIDLSERVYSLILEENRLLKQTEKPPEESVLNRKRDILAQLSESVRHLNQATSSPLARTTQQRSLIGKAQQIVLKTLLLDRENEQLLLKCTLGTVRPVQAPRPSASHLQRIYGKH